MRTFHCFTHFCGDGGSLTLGMLQKVPFTKREVVLCLKNYMKRAFRGKYIGGGGQIGAEGKKVSLL